MEQMVDAIKEITNVTWFQIVQLVISIFFSIATFRVAHLTFKLQKKVKEDDDKYRKYEMIKHVCNVYYFLNDIIYKMADTKFEYEAFNNIVVDGSQFMNDISFLRMKCITNQEFNLLRELYVLYDGIKNDPKKNNKNFKILYKKVIDINIDPKKIPTYRNNNDFDYIVSIQLLMIMKKLEYLLNDNIIINNSNVTIVFGNNMYIKKEYDKGYYLENNNGIISGIVKRYETVMFFEQNQIRLVNELIYKGEINNNKLEGKGQYYYHTTKKGFDEKIDSCMLNEAGVNLDIVAQEMKKYLTSESKDGHFKATYDGLFKNNNMYKGIVKYKLDLNDNEKEIKIERNIHENDE